MTNGEPLVVRGAMKPLPTLTKPLRSVDIDTKEPAQALRERTDSCTVPAAGVVGEAMVALTLAQRLRREAGRRSHRRRAGGAQRLQRADRVEALGRASGHAAAPRRPSAAPSCWWASWARASRPRARVLAAELGVESLDSDRELERELGEPIESFFDREGEPAFRAREERGHLRLLDRRPRARGRARRRRAQLGARARGAAASPGRAPRGRPRRGLAARLEPRPAARPRPRRASSSSTATACAVYESAADAALPDGRPQPAAPRPAVALRALRSAPAGTRLVWAAAESGEYPVFFGHGLYRPASSTRRTAAASWSPTRTWRATSGVAGEATIEIPPGESEKTLARAEEVLRELARAGATRGDLVVAVGGGVVGDLARLLRRGLPARHAPRAGADDARRAGRLGLRRQDRRGPARGQELRGRLPPAIGGARRPGHARHAAASRRRRPATSRW